MQAMETSCRSFRTEADERSKMRAFDLRLQRVRDISIQTTQVTFDDKWATKGSSAEALCREKERH